MTKEQINKVIDDTLVHFINESKKGFITKKELNDVYKVIDKLKISLAYLK